MRRNLLNALLLAVVLCLGVTLFTGCAKKASLRDEGTFTQTQQPGGGQAGTAGGEAMAGGGTGAGAGQEGVSEEALSEQEQKAQAEKEAAEAAAKAEAAAMAAAEQAEKEKVAVLEELQIPDIHFEFDKYNLTDEAQETLKTNAPPFLKYKNYKLIVEGHCDERGTVEYNLALGQKRADEAARYLVDLGIENDRIQTISYGKEMPIDKGHDEEAWAKNRRDHFVVLPPK